MKTIEQIAQETAEEVYPLTMASAREVIISALKEAIDEHVTQKITDVERRELQAATLANATITDLRAQLKNSTEIAAKYEDRYFAANAQLEAARAAEAADKLRLNLYPQINLTGALFTQTVKAFEDFGALITTEYEAERKATVCTDPAKRAAENLSESGKLAQWPASSQKITECATIITDSYAPILKEAREAIQIAIKRLKRAAQLNLQEPNPDLIAANNLSAALAKLEGGV